MSILHDVTHQRNEPPVPIRDVIAAGLGVERVDYPTPPQPDGKSPQQPAPQPDGEIAEIWPVMARLANHRAIKLGAEVRLWFWLWNHLKQSHNGQDWIRFDGRREAYNWLAQQTDYSPQQLRRLIGRGMSGPVRLWTLNNGRLWIVGQRRISRALMVLAHDRGVYDPYERERRKVSIPADLLTGPIGDYNAYCWAAWLYIAPAAARSITWAVMERAIGRSANTIRRWVTVCGVVVTENYATIPTAHDRAEVARYNARRSKENPLYSGMPHYLRWNHETYTVDAVYQRGNTYSAETIDEIDEVGAGMVRTLNEDKDSLWDSGEYIATGHESRLVSGCLHARALAGVVAERSPNVESSAAGRAYRRNNFIVSGHDRQRRRIEKRMSRRREEDPATPLYELSSRVVFVNGSRRARNVWTVYYRPENYV